MSEINLLDRLPKTKRDLSKRATGKTNADILLAKQFGKDFFDGDRRHGYGGYSYDGRWKPVAERFKEHYNLPDDAKILDVGCAKGFLMYDFTQVLPNCTVQGLEISQYAQDNAHQGMGQFITLGSAEYLPFDDNSFDLVVSINTIHNLDLDSCKAAIREIERVSKAHKFITVDAWTNEAEKQAVLDWILTAQTFMSVDEWKALFKDIGYTGDYHWFIP